MDLSWNDFHESGWYDVELYRGEVLVESLVKRHRGLNFNGTLSRELEKGKDYSLRVVPTDKQDAASDFVPVIVAPAIGLGLKLVPVILAGAGGVFYVISSGGSSQTKIPDPPGTPDEN